MFNLSSPFEIYCCSDNNLFKNDLKEEETEDYFFSQSDSQNSQFSFQNSFNNSQQSQSFFNQSQSQSQSLEQSQSQSQKVVVDINKDEQDINARPKIDIYINPKLFQQNPDINIICLKNNKTKQNSNYSNNKNEREQNEIHKDNYEIERKKNNRFNRGDAKKEINNMNMNINNLRI